MGDWNSVLILNNDADIKNGKKLETSVRFNKFQLRATEYFNVNKNSPTMKEKRLQSPFSVSFWRTFLILSFQRGNVVGKI